MVKMGNTLLSSPATEAVLTANELCDRYAKRVCQFAAMVARHPADADDLAQDALLRAIRGLDHFERGRGSVEGWLWRIVVNAGRDAARRHERGRWLLEQAWFHRPPPPVESPEAEVLGRIRDEEIQAQLRRLGPRDRILIGLRYGAGLNTAEVGAAVGLGPESAGRAIRRALDRLRRLLVESET